MWHFAIENAALSTLLAFAVWLASRSIRRPAVIHALWLIVLLKLITPPLLLVPVATHSHGREFQTSIAETSNVKPDVVSTTEPHNSAKAQQLALSPPPASAGFAFLPDSFVRTSAPLSWALGLLWIAGSICWFCRRLQEATRFSERIADSWNAPADLQDRAHQIATRFGLSRAPQVRIVPVIISPMLWGVGPNTRLLFPAGLLARLDRDSADTLLAHEIAHYRRGDHLVRLVELLISGLFWWHPVVWWIRRELEATEEKCCDAWVVHHLTTSPRCYAEALLATLDFLSTDPAPLPPAATGIGDVPLLRERLTEIMSGPPAPQIPHPRAGGAGPHRPLRHPDFALLDAGNRLGPRVRFEPTEPSRCDRLGTGSADSRGRGLRPTNRNRRPGTCRLDGAGRNRKGSPAGHPGRVTRPAFLGRPAT